MQETLEYTDLLRLIDERATAFRTAIAAAPGLDAQVPSCPDWTLLDLAEHIGVGRRRWAATVAAGPGATARAEPLGDTTAPRELEALLAWLAESTELLLDALRAAEPDRACFTGWGASQSPHTCAGVARRQLHEYAVHTYDAQLTAGAPEPLPTEVALDGVEEFLHTCNATTSPWPGEPTTLDYRAAEGRSWRLTLDGAGARAARLPAGGAAQAPGVCADAAASDLVLVMYGRLPLETLVIGGDRAVLDQLVEWDPEE
ncbi:maleylpyruvate isomerase family mycothiol-dependent enzyme [Kitasatospora sp. NPDC006697]|uniref:maleylpyruvate isomerase family mycothiol-dependent enzyme n=1 Tax=Kitasatospora sp. NPDC006697 TaxID=3364020 RepID=UPI0036A55610